MQDIRIVDVSTLPKETKNFKGISLPFYKGSEYGVMDLDNYQAHLVDVVGNKIQKDAGLILRFVGFTDDTNINTTTILSDLNVDVYFSNVKRVFIFKFGNAFYGKHSVLSDMYNDVGNNTARQDKLFLSGTDFYSYDSVKGGIMGVAHVDIVQEFGNDKNAVMSQDAISTKMYEQAHAFGTQIENINKALKSKVNSVIGKDLSSNDYTNEDKQKLGGIETGAQKNTVTGVKGDFESVYRKGDVNITKENIGLGKVDNTADADKPLSSPVRKAIEESSVKPKGGYMRALFEAVGAKYNEKTNFYELNHLTDITEEEMSVIYSNYNFRNANYEVWKPRGTARTNIPFEAGPRHNHNEFPEITIRFWYSYIPQSFKRFYIASKSNCGIYLLPTRSDKSPIVFYNYCGIEEIIGIINISAIVSLTYFLTGCKHLKKVLLECLKGNIDLSFSSDLTCDFMGYSSSDIDCDKVSSLEFLVLTATNDHPITVTVHHDVYIKIPSALVTKGIEKQISFADAGAVPTTEY